MEKKLKNLFDYQRFEKNPRLQKIIDQSGSLCKKELSDDELTFVNAAGDRIFDGGKCRRISEVRIEADKDDKTV